MALVNTGMVRFAATALGGSSIEWYDFFLYATAAVFVFPALFFPADVPDYVALIASLSTFAVGFVARPIGAVLFGHLGDRAGRRAAFVIVLSLMGFATTAIGLLPTYAEVGVAAPLALVFCRFAQGLAIGGHWGGVVLLLTENAPSDKRGFYGAFAQSGAALGIILANLAFLIASASLSTEAFMEWGWRCPFVVNFLLIGLALYAKFNLEETPIFQNVVNSETQEERMYWKGSPVFQALRKFKRENGLAAGAFAGVQVACYTFLVFVVAYATDPEGLAISRLDMLMVLMVSTAAQVPGLFVFSAYSDRHGRFGVYQLGCLLLGVSVFAIFPVLESGSLWVITIGFCLGQVIISMMYGPYAALLTELFSAEVRYSAASLSYQLGATFGGGLAPLVAAAILANTGSTFAISVYMALACLVSWVCLGALGRSHRQQITCSEKEGYNSPGMK